MGGTQRPVQCCQCTESGGEQETDRRRPWRLRIWDHFMQLQSEMVFIADT